MCLRFNPQRSQKQHFEIFFRNENIFRSLAGAGQRCWLTSAVGEAVEHVAFVTVALEAAGGVDAEVVTGSVKGALVNVCPERGT